MFNFLSNLSDGEVIDVRIQFGSYRFSRRSGGSWIIPSTTTGTLTMQDLGNLLCIVLAWQQALQNSGLVLTTMFVSGDSGISVEERCDLHRLLEGGFIKNYDGVQWPHDEAIISRVKSFNYLICNKG